MEMSANVRTKKIYRNIIPCLLRGSKKLSMNEIILKSIPALCSLPGTYHNFAVSEFGTINNPYGSIQIYDNECQQLHLFNVTVNGREASCFGLSSLSHDGEKIAICVGDGVTIWTTSGQFISYMTSPQVTNCCHVAAMDNGLLASTCITESREKCVTVWDPNSGKIVSQFGSTPEIVEINPLMAKRKVIIRHENIQLSWFITSDKHNNIFISDRKAKAIKVFDTRNSGKFLRQIVIDGPMPSKNQTIAPQGICTDSQDNIVVADSYSRSILLFDSNGKHIKPLLAWKDRSRDPWAVAISDVDYSTGGGDMATRLLVSLATPQPVIDVYKLSFCKHYIKK